VEAHRLRVGDAQPGAAAPEDVHVVVLEPRPHGGDLDRRGVDDVRDQVVVEVAPDAGQVHPRRDAVPRELLGRPDAREHQQARRLDRAGADHDLRGRLDDLRPAVAGDLDATTARSVEAQAEHALWSSTSSHRQPGQPW
jgi:hypothetical protein